MLSCKEAIQLITQAMDRPLRWKDRLGLWFHILMCRYCYRFYKQIHWLRLICKNESKAFENELLKQDSLPSEARDRIAEKITERLK